MERKITFLTISHAGSSTRLTTYKVVLNDTSIRSIETLDDFLVFNGVYGLYLEIDQIVRTINICFGKKKISITNVGALDSGSIPNEVYMSNVTPDQYDYNEDQLSNTFAGCLGTIRDLIGT